MAIRNGSAAGYPDDVSPLIGLADGSASAFKDLAAILPQGKDAATFTGEPLHVPGEWPVRQRMLDQMVCADLQPFEPNTLEPLGPSDVPEMLALTAATEPGPFLPNTITMGRYYGIRAKDGRLAAMAGQRLDLGTFVEISAVCTHPDFRGLGYARSLVGTIAARILSEGKVPFLHVKTENGARITYEKAGFKLRRAMHLTFFEPR